MSNESMKYKAFISYRHKEPDASVAKAIHRQIETYRVPYGVSRRTGQRKLGRVFRDQDELPLLADLGEGIRMALRQSEWLVVICSPELPLSKWCMAEINYFIELGRRERILTVLVAGEPDESFPRELRFIESEGVMTEQEPLAADVRASTAKRALGKLKHEKLRLIAPMLGVGYDDLRRRQRERFLRTVAGVSAAAMLAMTGATAYVLRQNAILDAERAAALESQSKFLAGMSGELLENGDPGTAALLALEALPVDLENPERPIVPEAITALRNATNTQRQGKYELLSGLNETFSNGWRYMEQDDVLVLPYGDKSRYYGLQSGQLLAEGPNCFAYSGERGLMAARRETDTDIYAVGDWQTPVTTIPGADIYYELDFVCGGEYLLRRHVNRMDGNYIELVETDTGRVRYRVSDESLFPGAAGESGNQISAAAASADGRYLAWLVNGGRERAPVITIADLVTGDVIRRLDTGYDPQVSERWFSFRGLKFSPDGDLLCAMDSGWGFQVFSTQTGALLYRLDPEPYDSSNGHTGTASFSPDSRYIAVRTYNARGYVYNASDGGEVMASEEAISYLGFTGESTLVFRHGQTAALTLMPLDTPEQAFVLSLLGLYYQADTTGLTEASVQTCEQGVVIFTDNGYYQHWRRSADARSDAIATVPERFGEAGNQKDVARAWSPNGRMFAVSVGGRISVRDAAGLTELAAYQSEARHSQLCFSPDGTQLLGVDYNGNVAVIEPESGRVIHEWPSAYTASPFTTVATIAPDWSLFALNNPAHTGGMYDLATGERLCEFPGELEVLAFVGGAAFSADSTRFYAGSGTELLVLDPRTGAVLETLPYIVEYGMALSPDGTRLAFSGASAAEDSAPEWPQRYEGGFKGLFVLDVASGEELWRAEAVVSINAPQIVWSPDGAYLTTTDLDTAGMTSVRNAQTGEITARYSGLDPSFSPDARYISLRAPRVNRRWTPLYSDYIGRIYDLETGLEFTTLPGAGTFSPDGETVLMQDAIWRVKPLAQMMAEARTRLGGRELTDEERRRFYIGR